MNKLLEKTNTTRFKVGFVGIFMLFLIAGAFILTPISNADETPAPRQAVEGTTNKYEEPAEEESFLMDAITLTPEEKAEQEALDPVKADNTFLEDASGLITDFLERSFPFIIILGVLLIVLFIFNSKSNEMDSDIKKNGKDF